MITAAIAANESPYDMVNVVDKNRGEYAFSRISKEVQRGGTVTKGVYLVFGQIQCKFRSQDFSHIILVGGVVIAI